jgi:hypothetical protein
VSLRRVPPLPVCPRITSVAFMEFVLNGTQHTLDAETVRSRVLPVPPDDVRTHWVEIDGRRWPPKQAFRVATGLVDEPFVSHFAIGIFRRLGFTTSPLPRELQTETIAPVGSRPQKQPALTDADSLSAYQTLDQFLLKVPLTDALSSLERRLEGADRAGAEAALAASGFDEDLIDSALVVRERVGILDTLIHAAVITHVLPRILDTGEQVLGRPSLGAGNDPARIFDLETTSRVAEFKLSSWKGADGMRQRGLFADVVGLSLDETGRRRQVYVVGELPVRFLLQSNRNAAKTLSKAAIRLRTPEGLSEDVTVSEYTRQAGVEVVDLTSILGGLR